jgi:hypothetical protein
VLNRVTLLVIPLLFLVLGLSFGSRQFHWDTLERASLIEAPAAYLHSWDGSPRSQFLSFAHVLELPLASLVRLASGGASGMQALIVFEALCAAAALFLFGVLIRSRGADVSVAFVAQAALACSWGFWKMGTSGEERILGLVALLAFLAVFWQQLRTGRWSVGVAGTLAFAILCHLSNAVLVPFALIGLLLLPKAQRVHRRRALRAIGAGSLVAFVGYAIVAAWTTGVRTPVQFWDYLTFFHRDTGNDFFTVSFAAESLHRSWEGLRRFFAAPVWIGRLTIGMLLLAVAWGGSRRRGRGLSLQSRHLLLLSLLWSLHFVFYEPANIESWTVVATALLIGAAWSLPRRRQSLLLGVVAVLLLVGNIASFRRLHRPMPLQHELQVVTAVSAPGDIILMGGGIQNGRPLRGSLATRYFLAFEKQRTIVSLYDILQITQPEFWDRPIGSVQELQAQIDAGRRVWFPTFLREEFDAAQKSGLVSLQVQAHGDSVFEVTSAQVPPR